MKFYRVTSLFIMLVRCLVHTPVRTPMYGLSLSQSDQRIRSVFQSVHNNIGYEQYLNHIHFHNLRCVPTSKQ